MMKSCNHTVTYDLNIDPKSMLMLIEAIGLSANRGLLEYCKFPWLYHFGLELFTVDHLGKFLKANTPQ